MARKQRNELAAGLFVVVALAAGVGVLLWLGAADLLAKPKQRAAFFANVDAGPFGLAKGSFVQVNDDVVGKITEIRHQPDKGRTLYIAEINRADIKIYANAEATVTFGVVGVQALVVTGRGSADRPLAGEEHPAEIISGALDRTMNDLAAVAESARRQLDPKEKEMLLGRILAIAESLQRQTNLDDPDSILAIMHSSTADLKQTTAAIRQATDPADPNSIFAKADQAITDVGEAAATIRGQTDMDDPKSLLAKAGAGIDDFKTTAAGAADMVKTIRPDIEQTAARIRQYTEKDVADLLVKMREANTELLKTLRNLKAISVSGRALVVLNRQRLEDTVLHLKVMSANLSAAAKEIRRNPWRLLHKPTQEQTDQETFYDAVRAFGEGAGQLRDAIARLEALSKSADAIAADDPALKKILTSLQMSFEKFDKVESALWEELTGQPEEPPAGGSGE